MTVIAIVVGAGFALLGPALGRILYPTPYDPLVSLWAGFGIHALFRLAAVGFGLPLAAAGLVGWRIAGHLASMSMLVLTAFLLAGGVDAVWSSIMLAASSLVLLVVLAAASLQRGWNRRNDILALLIVVVASGALMLTGPLWQ